MPQSSLIFIAHPPAPEQLFVGHYTPGLVALSIALAISAAYTALMVAQFATTQPQSRLRQTFMGLGGLAMGVGVWAMHFIGMLGFELPCPVAYDPWGTGLSIVPGLIASPVGWACTHAHHAITEYQRYPSNPPISDFLGDLNPCRITDVPKRRVAAISLRSLLIAGNRC